jgi:acetolactate synthase-1/3 small subunit
MTIVVDVQKKPLEQVEKQLHKLINVLKVVELEPGAAVERELALIKVRTTAENRYQVMEVAQIFRARVVDVSRSGLTMEVTGPPEKMEALVELLEPYGIVEMARTGRLALSRGEGGVRERRLRQARAS